MLRYVNNCIDLCERKMAIKELKKNNNTYHYNKALLSKAMVQH